MARSYLVLGDGSVYEGEPFGHDVSASGEVVFSTGMGGYQESLTDPSFRGRIVVMTYPTVGNYGVNDRFSQSDAVQARALVVREHCKEPSRMYGGRTLDSLLRESGVPGIAGIDTRELTVRMRTAGAMRGTIVRDADSIEAALAELRTERPAENPVAEVSRKEIAVYGGGGGARVGVLDCGVKRGVIAELLLRHDVAVFPYDTPADVIAATGVKGLLISDGPGDVAHPAIAATVVRTVDALAAEMPLFGIGFGSHAVAAAFGGGINGIGFGHRGCNHPVRFEGRIYMTSQNHGAAVDGDSLAGTGLLVDQTNVDDGTAEGLRHEDLPIFASQYHPEAAPGPRDTSFLFGRFDRAIAEGRL